MGDKLAGRVAIVTGATSGMGQATALLFAREGAAIVASGRDAGRGADTCARIREIGGRCEFVPGDVALPETSARLVERALASFGGVDVVAANAGVLALGALTEVALETWVEAFAVNIHAVFHLLRATIPPMQERGHGVAVVTASIAAYKGYPNHPAYCATKAALVALVRQVALDYAPAIRVNAICPGPVDTPLIWDSARAFPDPATAVAAAAAKTCLGRLGTPEEIARLALFLASDDSAWMTGSAVTIDGGMTCG